MYKQTINSRISHFYQMSFDCVNSDILVSSFEEDLHLSQSQQHQFKLLNQKLRAYHVFIENFDIPQIQIEGCYSIMLIQCKSQFIELKEMKFEFQNWEFDGWEESKGIIIRDCEFQTLDCTYSTWKEFRNNCIEGNIINKLILPKVIEQLKFCLPEYFESFDQNEIRDLVFNNYSSLQWINLCILPETIYCIEDAHTEMSDANQILDGHLILNFSKFINLTCINLQNLTLNAIILNQCIKYVEFSSFKGKLDYIDFSACIQLQKASIKGCSIQQVFTDVDIIKFLNSQIKQN